MSHIFLVNLNTKLNNFKNKLRQINKKQSSLEKSQADEYPGLYGYWMWLSMNISVFFSFYCFLIIFLLNVSFSNLATTFQVPFFLRPMQTQTELHWVTTETAVHWKVSVFLMLVRTRKRGSSWRHPCHQCRWCRGGWTRPDIGRDAESHLELTGKSGPRYSMTMWNLFAIDGGEFFWVGHTNLAL